MGQQRLQFASTASLVGTVDLRILETTDLHVYLHPYDYYADCPNPDLGLVRLSELIDQARLQVQNCLLFDNGDFLQGTPVGDFFAYDRGLKEGDLHPVMDAMNALKYDAVTIGNHEFNYGLDFLMKSTAKAAFPIVSANTLLGKGRAPRADRCLFRPYQLLRRHVVDHAGCAQEICIGVIGVAPPQITTWERLHLHNRIEMRDMVDSVAAWVPEMREAGADLVVLLAHSGIGAVRHTHGMENAVIPLARIEGVDLLLTGHSHQVFPSRAFADIPEVDIENGTICGKPVLMSGFFGSHLGVIDLRLQYEAGRWRVLAAQVENRALRDASKSFMPRNDVPFPARRDRLTMHSPKVRKIVARAHDLVLDNIRQPIGETLSPITSFFVFLGVGASTAIVANAQRDFVARKLEGSAFADLPILSSVSPSKAGGLAGPRNFTNIEKGILTLRSLADLYTYPNHVAALKLTGAQIAAWLERSASCYNQLHPGVEDEVLLNPAHPSYNFEIIYGLSYDIDLSVPAHYAADGTATGASISRIQNLFLNGIPIDPAAEFIVCTNSFRAHGAGGFAGAGADRLVLEAPETTRDILRQFVRSQKVVQTNPDAPFRLLAQPRKKAILRTAPAAHDYLDAIKAFDPEFDGVDKRGFIRVRVTL